LGLFSKRRQQGGGELSLSEQSVGALRPAQEIPNFEKIPCDTFLVFPAELQNSLQSNSDLNMFAFSELEKLQVVWCIFSFSKYFQLYNISSETFNSFLYCAY